jgi:hypothetical protein
MEPHAGGQHPPNDGGRGFTSSISTAVAAPRPGAPTKRTVSVVDITHNFQNAAQGEHGHAETRSSLTTIALQPGQLVKNPDFSLYESVSAVEIGDSKMDSGVLQPGEPLVDYFDLTAELQLEEVLWIMDELSSFEVAYHQGHPLGRTLFTSHHVFHLLEKERRPIADIVFSGTNPINPTDRKWLLLNDILRCYCILLVRGCSLTLGQINSSAAPLYDEEDFSMQKFGKELFLPIPFNEIRQILARFQESSNLLRAEFGGHTDLWTAFDSRINARVQLFQGFIRMESADYWKRYTADLLVIEWSHSLLKPVPSAFSFKLQRLFASTVPPRPVFRLEWDKAVEGMKTLASGMLDVLEERQRLVQNPDSYNLIPVSRASPML